MRKEDGASVLLCVGANYTLTKHRPIVYDNHNHDDGDDRDQTKSKRDKSLASRQIEARKGPIVARADLLCRRMLLSCC